SGARQRRGRRGQHGREPPVLLHVPVAPGGARARLRGLVRLRVDRAAGAHPTPAAPSRRAAYRREPDPNLACRRCDRRSRLDRRASDRRGPGDRHAGGPGRSGGGGGRRRVACLRALGAYRAARRGRCDVATADHEVEQMRAVERLREERGLMGKIMFVWLALLIVFLLAAWDTGSILLMRYKVSSAADDAAFEAAS